MWVPQQNHRPPPSSLMPQSQAVGLRKNSWWLKMLKWIYHWNRGSQIKRCDWVLIIFNLLSKWIPNLPSKRIYPLWWGTIITWISKWKKWNSGELRKPWSLSDRDSCGAAIYRGCIWVPWCWFQTGLPHWNPSRNRGFRLGTCKASSCDTVHVLSSKVKPYYSYIDHSYIYIPPVVEIYMTRGWIIIFGE